MKQTVRQIRTNKINAFLMVVRALCIRLYDILNKNVYFGRNVSLVPSGAIVFFPIQDNTFHCGIAAIVSFKSKKSSSQVKVVPPRMFILWFATAPIAVTPKNRRNIITATNFSIFLLFFSFVIYIFHLLGIIWYIIPFALP